MNWRLVFFPPDLALLLPVQRLAALQRTFGGLRGVDLSDKSAVARELYGREQPAGLADLLDETERLGGSDVVREAIVEGALAHGEMDADALSERPEVDVAIDLLLRAHGGDEVAKAVLRRARKRLGRLVTARPAYEVRVDWGNEAKTSPKADATLRAASLAVHGSAIVATWSVRVEGALHLVVVHRGPGERIAIEKDGEIGTRVRRRLACDVVAWDRGRIVFMLARPTRLDKWTRAIAGLLEGAERTALDRPAFTLKLLHERGSKWAEGIALPPGITSVEAVACELDNGTRFSARGVKALAAMHRRIGRGGYLYRSTLRFGLAGDPTDASVDATIELPGKCVVSIPKWRPLVRKAIAALGLDDAGSIPDDLVALAPFLQSDWRWIEVIGRDAFLAAIKDGILVPARSSRAGEPRHRKFGSMYVVHDLPGETSKYAVADDWALPAHDVAIEATMRWKLDVPRLLTVLRERLELAVPTNLGFVPKGIFPVGVLEVKDTRLVYFLMLRTASSSDRGRLTRQVRQACRGGHAVVIVGGERTLGGGVAEARVTAAEQVGDLRVTRAIVEGAEDAGLIDWIDGWRWGSAERPLVISKKRGEAWLGKVKLAITDNQLAMITALAEARGEWVTVVALAEKISPNAAILDQIVRKTRADLKDRVTRSFVDAGIAVPHELIAKLVEMEPRKGYRVGVGALVR